MTATQHLPIEDTDIYRKFVGIADRAWDATRNWEPINQQVIGKQLLRAVESIGANLVEGNGRFGVADLIHFFVIARASARETRHWIRRSAKRGLLSEEVAGDLVLSLEQATKALNNLIRYRREKAGTKVREERRRYSVPNTQHPIPNTSACIFTEELN